MGAPTVLAAVGLAGVLAACGSDPAGGTTVLQIDPIAPHPTIHLTDDSAPPLTVFVSNQSFDDDPVLITMAIDGVPLVDGRFFVEGQHNWVPAPIELPPGEHTMTATTPNAPTLTETFELTAGGRLWAVLNYWHYPDDAEGPHLSWFVQDEPVVFG